MNLRLGIVDYGVGNISSLKMAFEAVGAESILVQKPADLTGIDAIVLPGVGHFRTASAALHDSGLAHHICHQVSLGLPILGICLGFQLLTSSSAEAVGSSGLGLLSATCQRLCPRNTILHKVPHMGWNTLECCDTYSRLLHSIHPEHWHFYFANSYAISSDSLRSASAIQATYSHEKPWVGLVEDGPIFGVQFHPEKSREQGLQLLRNFLTLTSQSR